MLASVGSDKSIQVQDRTTGLEDKISRIEKIHKGTISGIVWLSDDSFATCSMDKTLRIWDAH